MERSLRNVLVVSFGFLLLFTAYGGLQSLQVRTLASTLASERLSLGLQEAPRPRRTGTEHFSFTPRSHTLSGGRSRVQASTAPSPTPAGPQGGECELDPWTGVWVLGE